VAALSQFPAKGRRKNKNWQRIMEISDAVPIFMSPGFS
jgi:hypothetical protein